MLFENSAGIFRYKSILLACRRHAAVTFSRHSLAVHRHRIGAPRSGAPGARGWKIKRVTLVIVILSSCRLVKLTQRKRDAMLLVGK